MKALAVYIRRTQRFPPSKTRKHVLTRGLHQKHYLSFTLSLFLVVMDFSVYSLHFLRAFKDNDTTNDTENNNSDNDNNVTRNRTIFRMCGLS